MKELPFHLGAEGGRCKVSMQNLEKWSGAGVQAPLWSTREEDSVRARRGKEAAGPESPNQYLEETSWEGKIA